MISPDTSLDDLTIVALDVETTGLSALHGDPGVRDCNRSLPPRPGPGQATYQSLVNPGRPISPGAAAVNHPPTKTFRMLRFWPTSPARFYEFSTARSSSATTLLLTSVFLTAELRRAGIPWTPPPVIDTLAIARSLLSV